VLEIDPNLHRASLLSAHYVSMFGDSTSSHEEVTIEDLWDLLEGLWYFSTLMKIRARCHNVCFFVRHNQLY
jgi:hypothetical protein